MEIKFNSLGDIDGNILFLVADADNLPKDLAKINAENDNIITDYIGAKEFDAKLGKKISIFTKRGYVVLAGIAKDSALEEKDIHKLGADIFDFCNNHKITEINIVVDDAENAAIIASGIQLKSYRFNKYFTKKRDEKEIKFTSAIICTKSHAKAEKRFDTLAAINAGVTLARDVVTETPNNLYPESYSKICIQELRKLGVKVEVLGEKEMTKLGMHALLGVGQGSEKESKMVVMQWLGGDKSSQPIAFVGKGVTFDTGGISIKPSNGMEDMKYDMGGSAAVVGLMKAVAGRKAKANIIGVIGLVENMPDGNAQRPADVVTSMSGQTIEVLNTDAEGRLVLADALWYTQDKFKPKFMIDLATLTGAVVVGLGVHRAGLMSNNDELSDNIFAAGESSGERVWRLPMGEEYDKQIDSKLADVQNISNMGGGGTITAGQFLQRFVNDTPWAHLDIAGVAWADKPKALDPVGATGFGVRLLDKMISSNYEK